MGANCVCGWSCTTFSCFVSRCFCNPVVVLYFLAQNVQVRSSVTRFLIFSLVVTISTLFSELSRVNVSFKTFSKNQTGALVPEMSFEPWSCTTFVVTWQWTVTLPSNTSVLTS